MRKRKYRFSTDEYFKIPLEQIRPHERRTFPLFIYLERNDHLILRYWPEYEVTAEHLDRYREQGLKYLWCPNQYTEEWQEYLEGAEEEEPPRSDTAAERELPKQKHEDISEQVVQLLSDLVGGDPDEAAAALEKCKEFAEEVTQEAIRARDTKEIYENILAVSRSATEHSVTVSTLSVLFALGLGYVDSEVLADIAMGALLHDIGYLALPPTLFLKPESQYDQEQHEAYHEHVKVALDLLDSNDVPITAPARRIILEHHERFDGKGYPDGIAEGQISMLSQIVSFADYLAELISGRADGKARSPADAFDEILECQKEGGPDRRFHPQVFSGLSLFVLSAKEVYARKKPSVEGAKAA